ncbi:hypothetical protein ACOJBM_00735 [Rhizobium beringeri]
MSLDDYMVEIVEPTFLDFHSNPNSPRYAYLACLTLAHVVDYAAPCDKKVRALKEEWIKLSEPFLIIDEVAQYFKHGTRFLGQKI